MDFEEWHHKQLSRDPDNCPHEKWERFSWDAAINECIKAATKEAADWTTLRDIAIARQESSVLEATNILAINRCIEAMTLMRSNVKVSGPREAATETSAAVPRSAAP